VSEPSSRSACAHSKARCWWSALSDSSAGPARLVRGIILSARGHDAVLAARGFGASHAYLLRRHLLPYTYSILSTQAALLVPQFILAEVTLSFLGIGIAEPAPSFGNLLAPLREYAVLANYWWMLVPAFVLAVLLFLYQAAAEAVLP
jgi:peptide/nickel transport system permease protein